MSYERLDELLEKAWHMDHSLAQVEVLEEAVRIADTLGNNQVSVEARMELVTAATFSGADEKALVAFAWALAKFDEDPDCVELQDLLWKYKWIIGSVSSFPTVSLTKLREMEDDMGRRYLAAGYNARPVHDSRADIALDTGDMDRCREYFQKWKATTRDDMADCRACEQNSEIRYQISFGLYEESLKTAEPILAGNMACSTVPQTTYGRVLIPLMHLGRLDEARKYHKIGYPLVSGNPDYIPSVSRHLLFMIRDETYDVAIRCVEDHLPLVCGLATVDTRMEFYCTVGTLLEKLAATREEVSLRLPEELEPFAFSGKYQTSGLATWFQTQTATMSARFDARNGNTKVTNDNAEWSALGLVPKQ